MLYAALPLHMQRGCFRIQTHDQQVTKAQLYRCTRARPHNKLTGLNQIKTVVHWIKPFETIGMIVEFSNEEL